MSEQKIRINPYEVNKNSQDYLVGYLNGFINGYDEGKAVGYNNGIGVGYKKAIERYSHINPNYDIRRLKNGL